jgi:hypothetical protein
MDLRIVEPRDNDPAGTIEAYPFPFEEGPFHRRAALEAAEAAA